jgi:hypothetical protein
MNSINLLFLLSIAITLYMSTQILAEDLVVTEATEEDNADVGARVFLHKVNSLFLLLRINMTTLH